MGIGPIVLVTYWNKFVKTCVSFWSHKVTSCWGFRKLADISLILTPIRFIWQLILHQDPKHNKLERNLWGKFGRPLEEKKTQRIQKTQWESSSTSIWNIHPYQSRQDQFYFSSLVSYESDKKTCFGYLYSNILVTTEFLREFRNINYLEYKLDW